MREPGILYEDKYILVLHKPAGMATQTASIRQEDLVSWAAKYRVSRGEDPYVGLLSRLDQPVEGIVVLAKDAKSAARLSRQIEDRTFQKYYMAVVCHTGEKSPAVQEEAGWILLEDYLVKDSSGKLSRVADSRDRRAKKAALCYRDVTKDYRAEDGGQPNADEQTGGLRILDLRLKTGRHHQIRVQLSHVGMPIVGDGKYGGWDGSANRGMDSSADGSMNSSTRGTCRQLGLFAYHAGFQHPKSGQRMDFDIPVPLDMYGFQKKSVIE